MIRNRKARLQRLEGNAARRGRCPACPPIAFIEVDADGNLLKGERPKRCARCGGPYGEIRFIEVIPLAEATETGNGGAA